METQADRNQQVEEDAQEGKKRKERWSEWYTSVCIHTQMLLFYLNVHTLINPFHLFIYLFTTNANVSDKTGVNLQILPKDEQKTAA